MPVSATAPAKTILCGEHAVVYGRPAIAVPIWQKVATATIEDAPGGTGVTLLAPDVGLVVSLRDAPADLPLAHVMRLALAHAQLTHEPDWTITLRSDIPIAGGLGSGAALGTALVRAILEAVGQQATPPEVSDLVYESERFYHGTPSGIDNTVIAWGRPIWFVRGEPPEPFAPRAPFTLLIADSGIRSPTIETVGDVRRAWQADRDGCERLFDAIAGIVRQARSAIETGASAELGRLFDANHSLLAELGVSSPSLERLVQAARAAGALGAKLSGGGRGGNVIALVAEGTARHVRAALLAAGAVSVIEATVS